ncbi:MAG: surface lipoprotein assembly modifier [Asticcacaulis sp.]
MPLPVHQKPCYRLAVLSVLMIGCVISVAQAQTTEDTRLRLDQQLERNTAGTEARLLQDAEDAETLTVDGRVYTVGNTVSETGQALYISVMRKQWPDAQRFLRAYLNLPGHDPMLVAYAQGGLARARGDLAAAETYFRELDALQSGFLPGQLELGRTLFENRKDREALDVFLTIDKGLMPDDTKAAGVRSTVRSYIDALEYRRNWHGSVAVGLGYNSNLNQSSENITCLLPGTDGECFFERRLPDAIGAESLSYEASINRHFPLKGHHGLHVRGLVYGEAYDSHSGYNRTTLVTQAGYIYRTGKYSLSIAPTYEAGLLGNSSFYDAWGARAEAFFPLSSSAALKIDLSHKYMKYRQSRYNAHTGGQTDVSVTLWQNLPRGLTLFAGPDINLRDTTLAADSSRLNGFRGGFNKSFVSGFNVFAMAAIRRRDYDGYSELLAATRRDDEQNYIVVFQAPIWSVKGLMPSVNLQHNRVRSNVGWLYSYERTAISLKLERHF